MNEHPNLSKEELEALLGSAPDTEYDTAPTTAMQGVTTEDTLLRLGAGLRALTAKVTYLEESVKELRLQLLEQERSAAKTREPSLANQAQAARAGDSRDEEAQRELAHHAERKLSRMERFGRRGR